MSKQVSNVVAVAQLASALKQLDDANPDVGMGPSLGYFIDQAARKLQLTPADYDRNHAEDLFRAIIR